MAFKTKLSVAFANFPYGGNGSSSSEHPDIRNWTVETVLKMRSDERVASFCSNDYSDTPIPMTRNRALRDALAAGYDLLLMVDSDQSPNKHKGEPWFKPFWETAFTFIYDNYHRGPRLVFAPYVGPHENVYCFKWNDGSSTKFVDSSFELKPYDRQEAALMSGIQECAAGPTGMILIDLRLLDLIEPSGLAKREVLERVQTGRMSVDEALWALHEGYFYYEWENAYAANKASTEDVTFTRDIALAGVQKLGYNPVFCAWDSWIGHHKPINVGKPQRFTSEHVGAALHKAFRDSQRDNEALIDLSQRIDPSQFTGCEADRMIAKPGRGICESGCEPVESRDEWKAGYRETTGPWHAHGHAPEEQRLVLADLVRSQAFRVNRRRLRVMEIGSWLGSTAIAMADADSNVVVHCVDDWAGSATDITGEMAEDAGGPDEVYAEFCRRIGGRINKSIVPWRKRSAEAAAMHWEPFDIIFIDAEHTYEACKADILNWWRHLADGGIMVGHDFLTKGCEGVAQAVRERFGDAVETIGWTPQGCMWLVRKNEVTGLLEKSNGQAVGQTVGA